MSKRRRRAQVAIGLGNFYIPELHARRIRKGLFEAWAVWNSLEEESTRVVLGRRSFKRLRQSVERIQAVLPEFRLVMKD